MVPSLHKGRRIRIVSIPRKITFSDNLPEIASHGWLGIELTTLGTDPLNPARYMVDTKVAGPALEKHAPATYEWWGKHSNYWKSHREFEMPFITFDVEDCELLPEE